MIGGFELGAGFNAKLVKMKNMKCHLLKARLR